MKQQLIPPFGALVSNPADPKHESRLSPQERERLLQLVKELDADSPIELRSEANCPSRSVDTNELTSAEVSELDRAKHALEFLHRIRCDHQLEAQTQTAVVDDTVHEASNDYPGKTPLPSELGPGSQFGRFEIQRLLGRGGFANVFLARDPSLDRSVALKILRESMSFSDDMSRRFEREAQAAAVLSHPNIVPVFETGVIGGTRYIATGFCDGETLQQWTSGRNTPAFPDVAALIIATIADAVEHAHQRGIVHRDLKPANILIGPHSGGAIRVDSRLPGLLMVADFGLAKLLQKKNPTETTEGTIVGTPAYMSPEQARGEADAGTTVDIYSLGVILYELLTGQLPLVGENNIDTLLMIGRQDPPPPRKIRSNIPKDLEAICLRCLEKSAGQRYATAHELARDLTRYLSGETVSARRVTLSTRAARWSARNPGFTVAFVAVAAALVFASMQWMSALKSNDRAGRHLQMAQEVISEMATRVARNPDLPRELRKSFTERAVSLQKQLLEEEPDSEVVAIQTALACDRLIVLLFDLAEFENALVVADQTIELLESFGASEQIESARQNAMRHKATILQALGDLNAASSVVEELAANKSPTLLDEARNHIQDGQARMANQKPLEAIVEYEKGLAILTVLANEDLAAVRIDMARTWLFLALAQFRAGQFDEATPNLEGALAEFLVMKDLPHAGEAFWEDAGRCYLYLGRISSARALPADAEPVEEFALVAEQHFTDAAIAFSRTRAINPGRLMAYGLEMMTLEMHVNLEFGFSRSEPIVPLLSRMKEVVDTTPRHMREFPLMQRIFAQAALKQIRLLIDKSSIGEANELLIDCESLLDNLRTHQPNIKDLESVSAEAAALRGEIDDARG